MALPELTASFFSVYGPSHPPLVGAEHLRDGFDVASPGHMTALRDMRERRVSFRMNGGPVTERPLGVRSLATGKLQSECFYPAVLAHVTHPRYAMTPFMITALRRQSPKGHVTEAGAGVPVDIWILTQPVLPSLPIFARDACDPAAISADDARVRAATHPQR